MVCSPQDKTINYIEFQVTDIEQTKVFYANAFGWTFTDYGPTYCEFCDGHMTGGFEKGTPQPGGPLIVLYGKELEEKLRAVQQAGGEITKEIFDFPGGKRFQFKDVNGYELAVWCES
jgi:uncharacterized protein